MEYDFKSAYGQKALDVAAAKAFAGDLKTSTLTQDTYMRFYSLSGPPAFDKAELPGYSCAILHTALEDFEKCQHISDNPSGSSKHAPASVGQ